MSVESPVAQESASYESRERALVVGFLRDRRDGDHLLAIARGTRLSAIVVVPLLDELIAEGIVQRRLFDDAGGNTRSVFHLTSMGRRVG